MRIICPYTSLHPETEAALAEHAGGCPVVFEDCRGSDSAYFEALASHWRAGAAFAVVEHDIVIHATVVPEFQACPEPWCSFEYELAVAPVETGVRAALGCTRFSAELLADLPDAIEQTTGVVGPCAPPRFWSYIDVRLEDVLRRENYRPHIHQPPVGHLNPNQRCQRPAGA